MTIRPRATAIAALALVATLLALVSVSDAAPRAARAGAGEAPWLIGYYPWYEAAEVPPGAVPYRLLTHVAVGNVHVTDGTCCRLPKGAATVWPGYVSATVAAAHRAHVKVLLQLGGADNAPDGWLAGTRSPAATARLAQSIVAYARRLGTDGVSLDWEQGVDNVRVGQLAQRLRGVWPKAIITVDVDPYDEDLGWAAAVVPWVDRIDAMTYVSVGDWGGWQGPWHQGALYGDSTENPFSVDRKMSQLRAAGVPARKLGFGLGLYGTGYGDANGDGRCPTAPTAGFEGEAGAWIADYELQLDDIERWYAPRMTRTFDETTRAPYLSAPAPGAGGATDGWPPKLCYITYEDAQSARAKGVYARSKGLGAVILWAVPQDRRPDGTFPVVAALARALR